MASRGKAAVVALTAEFESLARVMAANAGRPGMRLHVLPYPLETRPEGDVRAIARDHFGLLLRNLGVGGAAVSGAGPAATEDRAGTALPDGSADVPSREVDGDALAFAVLAADAGWGDGLPLVPPTEEPVHAYIAASGRPARDVIAELPPRRGAATVTRIAVNAVLAGAPAAAMPLLCAAVEAMADPSFNLFALNTTTSCVVPAVVVNGPARQSLRIPHAAGCFGGEAGPGPAIGRALRLVMRNVAGQVVGVSSKSVFGQPGRVVGMVVGEWEERSPWPPLAERRGVQGNAVTVHGATGTQDIADIVADRGQDLVQLIGRSLAFLGNNLFIGRHHGGEILLCLAPPWADLIAGDFPEMPALQQALFEHAAMPLALWPEPHRKRLEADGRVDERGIVHLVAKPADLLVAVCGGLGSLHALALHSFGPTRSVTRGF